MPKRNFQTFLLQGNQQDESNYVDETTAQQQQQQLVDDESDHHDNGSDTITYHPLQGSDNDLRETDDSLVDGADNTNNSVGNTNVGLGVYSLQGLDDYGNDQAAAAEGDDEQQVIEEPTPGSASANNHVGLSVYSLPDLDDGGDDGSDQAVDQAATTDREDGQQQVIVEELELNVNTTAIQGNSTVHEKDPLENDANALPSSPATSAVTTDTLSTSSTIPNTSITTPGATTSVGSSTTINSPNTISPTTHLQSIHLSLKNHADHLKFLQDNQATTHDTTSLHKKTSGEKNGVNRLEDKPIRWDPLVLIVDTEAAPRVPINGENEAGKIYCKSQNGKFGAKNGGVVLRYQYELTAEDTASASGGGDDGLKEVLPRLEGGISDLLLPVFFKDECLPLDVERSSVAGRSLLLLGGGLEKMGTMERSNLRGRGRRRLNGRVVGIDSDPSDFPLTNKECEFAPPAYPNTKCHVMEGALTLYFPPNYSISTLVQGAQLTTLNSIRESMANGDLAKISHPAILNLKLLDSSYSLRPIIPPGMQILEDEGDKGGGSGGLVAGILIPLLLLCCCGCCFFRWRRGGGTLDDLRDRFDEMQDFLLKPVVDPKKDSRSSPKSDDAHDEEESLQKPKPAKKKKKKKKRAKTSKSKSSRSLESEGTEIEIDPFVEQSIEREVDPSAEQLIEDLQDLTMMNQSFPWLSAAVGGNDSIASSKGSKKTRRKKDRKKKKKKKKASSNDRDKNSSYMRRSTNSRASAGSHRRSTRSAEFDTTDTDNTNTDTDNTDTDNTGNGTTTSSDSTDDDNNSTTSSGSDSSNSSTTSSDRGSTTEESTTTSSRGSTTRSGSKDTTSTSTSDDSDNSTNSTSSSDDDSEQGDQFELGAGFDKNFIRKRRNVRKRWSAAKPSPGGGNPRSKPNTNTNSNNLVMTGTVDDDNMSVMTGMTGATGMHSLSSVATNQVKNKNPIVPMSVGGGDDMSVMTGVSAATRKVANTGMVGNDNMSISTGVSGATERVNNTGGAVGGRMPGLPENIGLNHSPDPSFGGVTFAEF